MTAEDIRAMAKRTAQGLKLRLLTPDKDHATKTTWMVQANAKGYTVLES